MLDLETFGVNSHSPIIGLGACVFDRSKLTTPNDIPKEDQLNLIIDANNQPNSEADIDTIYWWMNQSDAARKLYAGHVVRENNIPPPLRLFDALGIYLAFCRAHKPEYAWCNGATFDHVILQSALDNSGLKNPFFYSKCLDARTLFKLANIPCPDTVQYNLTAHSALDDCLRQTYWLTKILTAMRFE
jgi:hypothetical protein